jgi:hypothetical protein
VREAAAELEVCDRWAEDPWFLREDTVFDAMGFSLDARRQAATQLARLYTPEACRAIRSDPAGCAAGLLLGQENWPGLLIPVLQVGRDLGVVQPWDDASLLKRLTKRNEFHEAGFELRVLANLMRAKYRAWRVQESTAQKTADLRVQIGLDTYEVEIKVVHDSPLDEAADRLNRRLARGKLMKDGLHLELRGSASVSARAIDDARQLETEFPAIVSAFEECIERISKPGTYGVREYGVVLAQPGPEFGSMTPVVLPDVPSEKRHVQVLRLVRRAAKQFQSRRGIAVIALRRTAELAAAADAIRAASAADPSAFGKCHMVVLADSVRNRVTDFGSIPLAAPVQVHARRQLTKAQVRFASVVARNGGHSAQLVPAAGPGVSGGVPVLRRGVTSVVLGSSTETPGAPIVFDINPYLPGAGSNTSPTGQRRRTSDK